MEMQMAKARLGTLSKTRRLHAEASSYARALTARLQRASEPHSGLSDRCTQYISAWASFCCCARLWDGLSATLLEQYHTRIELLSPPGLALSAS